MPSVSSDPLDLLQPPREPFRATLPRRIATIVLFLAAIWIVWLADALLFGGSLAQYGVVPRTARGIAGILAAPFLHASFAHVSSNSLGIILLGGLLILRSESAFWTVSLFGMLSSGLVPWVLGRSGTVHVGASGIIFAYFGFLLFAGIFERRITSLFLSGAVFFLWGGMLWSALPSFSQSPISWEAHLGGLAGGMLAAKLLAPNSAVSALRAPK